MSVFSDQVAAVAARYAELLADAKRLADKQLASVAPYSAGNPTPVYAQTAGEIVAAVKGKLATYKAFNELSLVDKSKLLSSLYSYVAGIRMVITNRDVPAQILLKLQDLMPRYWRAGTTTNERLGMMNTMLYSIPEYLDWSNRPEGYLIRYGLTNEIWAAWDKANGNPSSPPIVVVPAQPERLYGKKIETPEDVIGIIGDVVEGDVTPGGYIDDIIGGGSTGTGGGAGTGNDEDLPPTDNALPEPSSGVNPLYVVGGLALAAGALYYLTRSK